MRFYWIKTCTLIKWLFPKYVWEQTTKSNRIYLTFDDGPIPEATPWVLDLLQRHNAKATFFCIGENASKNPELLKRILNEGHAVGNHTYNHVNGWQTNSATYINNVDLCTNAFQEILKFDPKLFRPPYGKLKSAQANELIRKGFKIIMWDVLSADFDTSVSAEDCANNVLKNIKPGSIVIFHDSLKAFKNLEHALPATLKYIEEKGYICEVLS